jgi:hypothetical protein
VRDFTRQLHRSGFDIDVEWRQPNRPTRRVHLAAGAAGLIAAAIESSQLDVEEVVIEGVVLTVSTVRSQEWLIEQTDGEHVSIKHSGLPHEQAVGIATGDRVRITAQLKTVTSNAGVTKATYEALSVEVLDESARLEEGQPRVTTEDG